MFALALAAAAGAPPAAHAHPSAPEGDVTACGTTTGTSTVASIQFDSPDGTYTIDDTIRIRVTTSDDTDGNTFGSDDIPHIIGHTRIKLETGSVDRFAEYGAHANYGRVINYTYTVQAGDESDDLD